MWSCLILSSIFFVATFAAEDVDIIKSTDVEEPKKIGIVYFVQLLNQPSVLPRENLDDDVINEAVNNKLPTSDFVQENPRRGLLLIRPLLINEADLRDEKPHQIDVSNLFILMNFIAKITC